MSISKIINKILNYFNNQNQECNSLHIKIYNDGFFDIKYAIENKNLESMEQMADLLYKLNNGKLYDTFVQEIMEHTKSYPEDSDFMLNIILRWGVLLKKHTEKNNVSINDPIIKPSKAFYTK